ncbi:MAG: tetratricopeptide repeat protein [Magnetococcales bacterium]|nr:tetratricopeptide repeat protein [Magnetococcales bacterium]
MATTPFQAALIHHQAGRLERAVAMYERILAEDPDEPRALANLAIALNQLRRHAEAETICRRAIRVAPNHAEAWNHLGIILSDRRDFTASVEAYRRCVEIDPAHHLAWTNLGIALVRQGVVHEAIHAFRRALEAEPDHTQALMHLIHQKQQACDWSELDPLILRLVEQMRRDQAEINPFSFLFFCRDPGEMRLCADRFAGRVVAQARAMTPVRRPVRVAEGERRLRVGYLSGDLHQHATAVLARELFAAHDRTRFQIFGYSYGPDDHSEVRRDLERNIELFRDCASLDDATLAQRIADDQIDILVDLKGYTRDARPCVMALRPAPLQVAYLGYPGTMGGDFIDYVVADQVVLPEHHRPYFAEQPIWLAGSYQVNDSQRRIDATPGARRAHGLPEEGVVFCCFNQTVKITPDIFGLWLHLLRAVPGSCLWLLAFNAEAQRHVRGMVSRIGMDPGRLIFAPPLPHAQHLARYRLADLFLDTLPCNAHTTASDALWAGCPVVTLTGTTFAGRVGASLLTALGFPEWIASDLRQYGRIALELAQDRQGREQARTRLRQAVLDAELFSGAAFARKLEAAFRAIQVRHVAGLTPAPLRVTASGAATFDNR